LFDSNIKTVYFGVYTILAYSRVDTAQEWLSKEQKVSRIPINLPKKEAKSDSESSHPHPPSPIPSPSPAHAHPWRLVTSQEVFFQRDHLGRAPLGGALLPVRPSCQQQPDNLGVLINGLPAMADIANWKDPPCYEWVNLWAMII